MEPSLFTWPMTKMVSPSPLASCIRAMVHSFTWLMLPWYRVWMESTMSTSGETACTASMTFSRLVSDRRDSPSPLTWSRSARSLICRRLSSPETYRMRAPEEMVWQICSSRVDLPMPGSPLSKTTEPGTMPPPSTRLSSPIPVR